MKVNQSITITGFMGVGKSTVARHLAGLIRHKWIDLDDAIEKHTRRSVAEILDNDGLKEFRALETAVLEIVLQKGDGNIISLGGGAFTTPANRELIRAGGVTSIWLEATFEHCWANIRNSYKDRPLARDRQAAKRLYDERNLVYCLADWHFLVQPGCNSYSVAGQIAEQVFGIETGEAD